MRISCGWFAWALLAATLYVIIGVGFAPAIARAVAGFVFRDAKIALLRARQRITR
jgi:hypothetical protein